MAGIHVAKITRPALPHHLFRDQLHLPCHQRRQEDHIIQIPEHRHEIRNQVDGRQGVRHRQKGDGFCGKGRIFMAEGQEYGGDVGFELPGAGFQVHDEYLRLFKKLGKV